MFSYSFSSVLELSSIPEINLALIIGPIRSSFGLHPWLTRLTEFMYEIFLPLFSNLNFSFRILDSYKQIQTTDSFTNIVQRYNQIEQRQGR